jgi:predicted NBD/HSP70 family sugar kinase
VVAARRLGLTGRLTAKQVFDWAREGNKAALAAVHLEAGHLARAIAALVAILDPELVVLGGGIGRNGDLLMGPIERRLRRLLSIPAPRIVTSALGDDAVVLGALAIALAKARERVFTRAMGD